MGVAGELAEGVGKGFNYLDKSVLKNMTAAELKTAKQAASENANKVINESGGIGKTLDDLTIHKGDSFITKSVKRAISPVVSSFKGIYKLVSKNGKEISAARKYESRVAKRYSKQIFKEANKTDKIGIIAKRSGNLLVKPLKGLAVLGGAAAVTYFGKKAIQGIFDGNTNATSMPKNSTPAFDPSSSNIGLQNGGSINPSLVGILAADRSKIKSDTDTKIAEAKASLIADTKAVTKLTNDHSILPDNLQKIYAKQNSENGKSDAIIELLNRQNIISNEQRRLTLGQVKQQNIEVRSRLNKDEELYRGLMKLKAQQSNANTDAINTIEKSTGGTTNAVNNLSSKQNSYKTEAKKSSLLKWALFGGLLAGLGTLIKLSGGIGNAVSAGFNALKSGVEWIGSGVNNAVTGIQGLLGIKSETKDSDQSNNKNTNDNQVDDKTLSNSAKQANQSGQYNGKVTNKDLTKNGEINDQKLADRGINKDYKAHNLGNHLVGATFTGLALKGAYNGSKYYNNSAYNQARKAGISKNKSAWLERDELRKAKIAKDEKLVAAKIAREAKIANSGNLFTRGLRKIGNWGINSYHKVSGAISKAYGSVTKSLGGVAWKTLGKIIGPKNAKVISKLFGTFSKMAARTAGKAGARIIPGIGTIWSIYDACVKGFKHGDWTGALIDALAGIAYAFPGVGDAVGIALNSINVGRDIHNANKAEEGSAEVTRLLNQYKKTGDYKQGKKGDLFTEVLRKIGNPDDPYEQQAKNKLITQIAKIYEQAKKESWSRAKKYDELNKVLRISNTAASSLKYNTASGTLLGIKSYAKGTPAGDNLDNSTEKSDSGKSAPITKNNGTHPGGLMQVNDQVDDNGTPSKVYKELVITPNLGSGYKPKYEVPGGLKELKPGAIYAPQERNQVLNAPEGTVVLKADAANKVLNNISSISNVVRTEFDNANGKGKQGLSVPTNIASVIDKKDASKDPIDLTNENYKPEKESYFQKIKRFLEEQKKKIAGKLGFGADLYGTSDGTNFNGIPDSFDKVKKAKDYQAFNVIAAINTLNKNASKSSRHICARNIRLAMEAGFGGHGFKHPNYAKDYINYLPDLGFQAMSFNGYNPEAGDIMVYPKPGAPNQPGHITMFNGKNWVSDFLQNNAFVYSQKPSPGAIVFRNKKAVKNGVNAYNIIKSYAGGTQTYTTGQGMAFNIDFDDVQNKINQRKLDRDNKNRSQYGSLKEWSSNKVTHVFTNKSKINKSGFNFDQIDGTDKYRVTFTNKNGKPGETYYGNKLGDENSNWVNLDHSHKINGSELLSGLLSTYDKGKKTKDGMSYKFSKGRTIYFDGHGGLSTLSGLSTDGSISKLTLSKFIKDYTNYNDVHKSIFNKKLGLNDGVNQTDTVFGGKSNITTKGYFPSDDDGKSEFVKTLYKAYLQTGLNNNVAAALVTQDAYESGWGTSRAAGKFNNYGGIGGYGKHKVTGERWAQFENVGDFVNSKVYDVINKKWPRALTQTTVADTIKELQKGDSNGRGKYCAGTEGETGYIQNVLDTLPRVKKVLGDKFNFNIGNYTPPEGNAGGDGSTGDSVLDTVTDFALNTWDKFWTSKVGQGLNEGYTKLLGNKSKYKNPNRTYGTRESWARQRVNGFKRVKSVSNQHHNHTELNPTENLMDSVALSVYKDHPELNGNDESRTNKIISSYTSNNNSSTSTSPNYSVSSSSLSNGGSKLYDKSSNTTIYIPKRSEIKGGSTPIKNKTEKAVTENEKIRANAQDQINKNQTINNVGGSNIGSGNSTVQNINVYSQLPSSAERSSKSGSSAV